MEKTWLRSPTIYSESLLLWEQPQVRTKIVQSGKFLNLIKYSSLTPWKFIFLGLFSAFIHYFSAEIDISVSQLFVIASFLYPNIEKPIVSTIFWIFKGVFQIKTTNGILNIHQKLLEDNLRLYL